MTTQAHACHTAQTPRPDRAVATPQLTILNHHFGNCRPQKSTLHAAIVSCRQVFLYQHLPPSFFWLRWKEIMQMEMGTRRKKCWHLLSSPPLNTHTHLTHRIQGVFCWPASVALSLLAVSQAHFNNRSHVACALSFLLFRSGPLHSEGTGAQTDRRNSSSSVQANSVGLFNFGRRLSVAACYFEEKLPLIGSFDEATCSHI